MSVHDEIMALTSSYEEDNFYAEGYNDGLIDAARLAVKADAEIQNLKADLLVAKELYRKRFNEGLLCGNEASRRILIEVATLKESYLNENEKLTTLLLNAEDKIEDLTFRHKQLSCWSERQQRIDDAAKALIKCKGRHHSEQNMKALIEAVNAPCF